MKSVFITLFQLNPQLQCNDMSSTDHFSANTMVSFPPHDQAEKFFHIVPSTDGQSVSVTSSLSLASGTDTNPTLKNLLKPGSPFNHALVQLKCKCSIHRFQTFDITGIGLILFRHHSYTDRDTLADAISAHILENEPNAIPNVGITARTQVLHINGTIANRKMLTLSCDRVHSNQILQTLFKYPLPLTIGTFLAFSDSASTAASNLLSKHIDLETNSATLHITGLHHDVLQSPCPASNRTGKTTIHTLLLTPPSNSTTPLIISIDKKWPDTEGAWDLTIYQPSTAQALNYASYVLLTIAPTTHAYRLHVNQSPVFANGIIIRRGKGAFISSPPPHLHSTSVPDSTPHQPPPPDAITDYNVQLHRLKSPPEHTHHAQISYQTPYASQPSLHTTTEAPSTKAPTQRKIQTAFGHPNNSASSTAASASPSSGPTYKTSANSFPPHHDHHASHPRPHHGRQTPSRPHHR